MRSWTLIVSYLWKDTWSRWLEQPSSLLARLSVGLLLVSVATVILVAFSLLERGLRDRLESFGLNTVIVRETVMSNDPELLYNSDRPDRLGPLAENGLKLRLRQLLVRAQSEWQNNLLVMSYPPDVLPYLAPWMSPESPLIYLSDALPEGVQMRVSLSRQSGDAVVRKLGDFWRTVAADNLLLVPQGWSPEAERLGFIETTLFQRQSSDVPIATVVEAVNQLYLTERKSPPQVQSSLNLIRELETLQARQQQWRGLLALVLGLTMALVYGAISVLEFRQNLFITALLRSLGAPGKFLYGRQWIENVLLANFAAVAAICLVALFHQQIFGTLGFNKKILAFGQENPYWSSEVGLILLCVNIGAFLSSLPVAVGLRRPVGAILN